MALAICALGVTAQNVTIPDANFKAALLANTAINTVNDGEISVAEAAAFGGTMNVASQGITDFTGIEAFTALDILYCGWNSSPTLDLSACTSLTVVECEYSSELDFLNIANGNNGNLVSLFAEYVSFTCIQVDDVNNLGADWHVDFPNAYSVDCWPFVNIPDANFKAALLANTAINTVADGEISVAEAAAYSGQLFVGGLSIVDLTGIEAFTALGTLHCYNNQITALDLSFCTSLSTVNCSSNSNLTTLNVANGNNQSLSLNATVCTNLSCVKVDDVSYAMSASDWLVDNANVYSLDCGPFVNIPDANFKAALLANTAINTANDGEISFAEAAAYTENIQVSQLGIADLTGIEAFTAITVLYCHFNQLTTLDVSNNTALIQLSCGINPLTMLDVSVNTNLEFLFFQETSITSIDLSANVALINVIASNTGLSSLDLSFCPSLTSIDVSSCFNLTTLNVANGNNGSISLLSATNSAAITCIKVDDVWLAGVNPGWSVDNTNVYSLDCGPFVNIPDATFKSLLVGNTAINTVADSEISFAEAAAFSGALDLFSTGIADLTGIEAFTALTSLDCGSNQLTTLDVSANVALTTLLCDNNQLTSLNVANGNNLNFVLLSAQSNPNLSCIQVDDATYSSTSWLPENGFTFDLGVSFSEDCNLFVGLNEASNLIAMSVYPNPATDLLTIRAGNADAVSYNVLDLSGRSILNGNMAQISSIDVSSLSAGSYLIQVTTELGNAMQQFMKH